MCGHPPELEILCDECFGKNRYHDCKTCTHYKDVKASVIVIPGCIESGILDALPDKGSCLLYAPKFCKECEDNLDRLCFCCGIRYDEPVDGCCESCR